MNLVKKLSNTIEFYEQIKEEYTKDKLIAMDTYIFGKLEAYKEILEYIERGRKNEF